MHATWPEWRFEYKTCCRECHVVFKLMSPVSGVGWCPLCMKLGKRTKPDYDALRWISTSVWYKPMTWCSGYWVPKNSDGHRYYPVTRI